MTAGPVMTHRSAGRELTTAISKRLSPSRQPQPIDYTPRQFPENQNSPALLENGVRTLVPPHIEAGIRVVINTADGSYVERAKD